MKFVWTILLLSYSVTSINLQDIKGRIKQAKLTPSALGTDSPPQREMFMSEGNMPMGNEYTEQLQTTSSNVNSMMGHSRRNGEMKEVGNWFSDIDERLDDFRDAVNRKLNEMHMALQRPKPMMAPPMMQRGMMQNMETPPVENEVEPETNAEDNEERLRRMMMRMKMKKMRHI